MTRVPKKQSAKRRSAPRTAPAKARAFMPLYAAVMDGEIKRMYTLRKEALADLPRLRDRYWPAIDLIDLIELEVGRVRTVRHLPALPEES